MDDFFAAPSRRRIAAWTLPLVLLALAQPRLSKENFFSEGGEVEVVTPLPPIPTGAGDWIGTPPLTNDDLLGRVWILKVWTFGCVNCVKSIPFTNELMDRFDGQVGVLGIHSPEFDWERDREHLARVLDEHDVRFPSYVDQSLEYFMALEAPGWPMYYVVDKRGDIRGSWFGEVHAGTFRDRALTKLVERLVAEPYDSGPSTVNKAGD